MTLYEFLKISECDYDTFDTEYDVTVTVCSMYNDEEKYDDYDRFCADIMKKVNVVNIYEDSLEINWCELIKRNMSKFKEFTAKHWIKNCQYEDDIDEFIYQWINEIHYYMAGYVSEDFYSTLNKFIDELE